MSNKLNWDLANKRDRVRFGRPDKVKITVAVDEAFWRAWNADPDAMRASGFRVRKQNGQWHAWIER